MSQNKANDTEGDRKCREAALFWGFCVLNLWNQDAAPFNLKKISMLVMQLTSENGDGT